MDEVETAGGKATVGAVGRAMRYPKAHPARTGSHFAEFAVHLLSAGRLMATGALVAAFANQGNELGGADAEARLGAAEAALKADDRLDYSDELGGWHIKGDEQA